jgi:hypothetical protein
MLDTEYKGVKYTFSPETGEISIDKDFSLEFIDKLNEKTTCEKLSIYLESKYPNDMYIISGNPPFFLDGESIKAEFQVVTGCFTRFKKTYTLINLI